MESHITRSNTILYKNKYAPQRSKWKQRVALIMVGWLVCVTKFVKCWTASIL